MCDPNIKSILPEDCLGKIELAKNRLQSYIDNGGNDIKEAERIVKECMPSFQPDTSNHVMD